ncbi:MAG TPA: hypothetical protein VK157_04290 [Phycisphaerales bacterium]|nr:hypothetical protein [Phycisphaerales bacterium]
MTPPFGPGGEPDGWRARAGGAIARPMWELVRRERIEHLPNLPPWTPLAADFSAWRLHPFDVREVWLAVLFLTFWIGAVAWLQIIIMRSQQHEKPASLPIASVMAFCVVVVGSMTAAGRFAGVPVAMDRLGQVGYWGGSLLLIVGAMLLLEMFTSMPRRLRIACVFVLFLALLFVLMLVMFYVRGLLDLGAADSLDMMRSPHPWPP